MYNRAPLVLKSTPYQDVASEKPHLDKELNLSMERRWERPKLEPRNSTRRGWEGGSSEPTLWVDPASLPLPG